MRPTRFTPRYFWFAVTAVYVGLTLAYARPLLPVMGSALPNDTGDPGLNTWILWWNAHAVPLTSRWWDAPIFYPAHGALALSETFLNLAPLSSPMQWAGASAVFTYNVLYLLSFVAAGLAAHALARRLTGRHDAAFIAGLAFAFAPYRAAQMPHLQTLWSCWMPLALLALHRYLAEHRRRDLWLFGLCWVMNGLSTGYYLFFFVPLVGLWVVWFARTSRDLRTVVIAIVLASLPLAPLLIGYQHYQSAFGVSRSLQEIESFSADLSAIWATTPYVWPHLWTLDPRPEGELYPGLTILALTVVGACVAWRRARRSHGYRAQPWLIGAALAFAIVTYFSWRMGGWTLRFAGLSMSLTRPAKAVFTTLCITAVALFWNPRIVAAWRHRSALLFYTGAAVLMLLFALGPVGHFLNARFLYQAPYYWLMQLPGGHAFRVPARFGMLFMVCLAQAAALAYGRLTPRGANPVLAALLCVAVAAEGFVANMGVAKVPVSLELAGLDHDSVLLEVPIVDDYSDTEAMLRATETGHTLVNGFSGYLPPHYALLREGLQALDGSIIASLQECSSFLVFVHRARDTDGHYGTFVAALPGAHRLLTTDQGTLFQFPKRATAAVPAESPVRLTSARASVGTMTGAEITDGDVTTRWHTPYHQAAGDGVAVTLERPTTVSRIEMDLGPYKDDYPRKLRIAVVGADGAEVPVWEGRTTGTAMIAALADRKRMPLVFRLSPLVRGTQVRFTVLDGHPELSWSIAELRIFGS